MRCSCVTPASHIGPRSLGLEPDDGSLDEAAGAISRGGEKHFRLDRSCQRLREATRVSFARRFVRVATECFFFGRGAITLFVERAMRAAFRDGKLGGCLCNDVPKRSRHDLAFAIQELMMRGN